MPKKNGEVAVAAAAAVVRSVGRRMRRPCLPLSFIARVRDYQASKEDRGKRRRDGAASDGGREGMAMAAARRPAILKNLRVRCGAAKKKKKRQRRGGSGCAPSTSFTSSASF